MTNDRDRSGIGTACSLVIFMMYVFCILCTGIVFWVGGGFLKSIVQKDVHTR